MQGSYKDAMEKFSGKRKAKGDTSLRKDSKSFREQRRNRHNEV